MKITSALATLFALAAATPTPTVDYTAEKAHLVKRASISDKATLGYATLNGGTSGGSGGTVTTVSTLAEFTAAVNEKDTAARIVVVKGTISGTANVRIGSNKSVIGASAGAGFNGIGLHVRRMSNVIIRNIKSTNVLASTGDGVKIEESINVWIDHCEFSSALVSDKDYYDGLVDASHAADYMTISYTYFHDHWKTSLVGHSENNGAEDSGHLRITYANNYWANFGSRGPSLRFGTGHVLIQSNVFKNVTVPITSQDSDIVGYAVAIDNDLGGASNLAPVGTMNANSPPYSYSLLGSANVVATVPGQAGQKLTF
ncbi:pectate lyase [Colletotrichum cuscutae]|uniref:Pectate lyase n=1 Tax=Colletotrichum cuscutae TaxID=1209917 RepID=A0AAI9V481_9PEZI|nr:pectate lyase [Colletotrichum cuscutae]